MKCYVLFVFCMMNDRDKLYIGHMLDAIADIEKFLTGKTEKEFMDDDLLRSAVIRKFEILGEAAKRVSEECRGLNQDVAWRMATGMRDVLIHDYLGVDAKGVWNTASEDLPHLKASLQKIS